MAEINLHRLTNSSTMISTRISSKITKSIIDKEKSYLKNPLDYNISVIKINIIYEDNIFRSINLQITDEDTIKDILKQSIECFNDLFNKENKQLDKDYNKYYLKPSKKSGKPDNDLPSI